MVKKTRRADHLKVIEGKGKPAQGAVDTFKNPLYFLLVFLAFFLLAQILFGLVWSSINQGAINTFLAGEGSADISFPVAGIITFSEKVILAPRSGFVYYKVKDGERVPVGKELAGIRDYPGEENLEGKKEEGVFTEYFQQIREWFLGESIGDLPPYFSIGEEVKVLAPLPGVVSFRIDGFEKFGPDFHFPYIAPAEVKEKAPEESILSSGEKVLRSTPLLKLVNNYYWYFSAIISPEEGQLIGERSQDKLVFSFAPQSPVWGRKVESLEEAGGLKITWCIDRELPDLFQHRLATAEIVYKNLEGIIIPKSAVLELEGKKGVYVIEKGLVTFREIKVLLEREDDFLVNNIELYERVVAKPEKVKEGQRFYW